MIHCYDYFWSAWTAITANSFTIRNFQGNTAVQTMTGTPHEYVIGPAQMTFPNWLTSTDAIHHGTYQGLYLREQEAATSPDGNVWFRWIEDQPLIGVAPTNYTPGVV